jgi:hypothetical protein
MTPLFWYPGLYIALGVILVAILLAFLTEGLEKRRMQ